MSDTTTPSEKDTEGRTNDNDDSVMEKVGDAVGNAKESVLKLGGAFKRGVSDARDDL